MARNIDLVKKEMAYNRFRLSRIRGISYDDMVAEIAYCLYAKPHEQTIVPSGILFCRNDISDIEGVQIRDVNIPIDDLRTLADGRRTFLILSTDAAPKLAVLKEAISDEIRLLELSAIANGTGIIRDEVGIVTIAQKGEIWRIKGRQWERKPPFYKHLELIEQCLGTPPGVLSLALTSLLRITYYFLSSRNVGSTLVWRVGGSAEQTLKGLSNKGMDIRCGINTC